ncbi:OadG family protein [Zongyangia hominis]|nr:OadG family protein [Zongyangia hominis]
MDWNLALSVILSGIVIVFLALVILIAAVLIVGKIMTSIQGGDKKPKAPKTEKKAEEAKPAASAPQAAMKVERGIPGEVVAAISAAVASIMGSSSNFTIRSVKRAREARPVWSLAGMMKNTKPF